MTETAESLEDIEVVRRRFEQLTKSRLRDRKRMKEASDRIDEIRESVGEASLSEKVSEWRKKRRASNP